MTQVKKNNAQKASKTSTQELKPFSFTRELIPNVSDPILRRYRETAWEAYDSLPFPSREDQAWRRTDIRGLNTVDFILHHSGHDQDNLLLDQLCIEPVYDGDAYAGQILAGSMERSQHLDKELADKGVIFVDYLTAEKEHPDLLKQLLGQIIKSDKDKFTALASALAQDGVVLYLPKNVVIEKPLHSLYCGALKNHAYINHLLIWLEEGAEVTFVHESTSPAQESEGQVFHNGIVEIHVGNNAKLNFIELVSFGENVWSITRECAHVMGDGVLEWIYGAMGTRLTKNFSDIDLIEPGAKARMSGFYFANGQQHLDHDTQQNHLAEETTSDLLFKGALLDYSRSVWQGMIYVAPGASGTDGYQSNRNLILSKNARADSIPGLEILADDVICTHGATIGKIDENELFYLLSRGIPRGEAEQLIVKGFFAEILERIPFDGVKERFLKTIREKMSK